MESVCGALMNLTIVPENKNLIVDAGLIPALMKAMDRHPTVNTEFIANACGIFRNISINEDNRRVMLKHDSLLFLLKSAMTNHSANAEIQEHVCCTLISMAMQDEIHEEIIRTGFMPYVKKAMETHANSENVQENACGVLFNLAANPVNRNIISEMGFIPLIKNSIIIHPKENVLQRGCGALRNLVTNFDCQVSILKSGLLPVIRTIFSDAAYTSTTHQRCNYVLTHLSDFEPRKLGSDREHSPLHDLLNDSESFGRNANLSYVEPHLSVSEHSSASMHHQRRSEQNLLDVIE
jgi:hypothetical protein